MTTTPDPMKPNMAESTGPDVQVVQTEDSVQRRSKEAYFTASQGQLIWARFKKQRAAMVAACVLAFLVFTGIFAPFLSPYNPTIAGKNDDYTNGAPQIPMFCDANGCSLAPVRACG